MAYRFGPFLYDPVSSGLLREGVEVPLTHKSRELLHTRYTAQGKYIG